MLISDVVHEGKAHGQVVSTAALALQIMDPTDTFVSCLSAVKVMLPISRLAAHGVVKLLELSITE